MRIIKSFTLIISIGIAAVGLTVSPAKATTVVFDDLGLNNASGTA